MKKNKDLIRQFIFVIIIGLAVIFFSGEYEWSYTFDPTTGLDLETALNYLNLALPIVAMVLGLGVILYLRIRQTKGEEQSPWEEEE